MQSICTRFQPGAEKINSLSLSLASASRPNLFFGVGHFPSILSWEKVLLAAEIFISPFGKKGKEKARAAHKNSRAECYAAFHRQN